MQMILAITIVKPILWVPSFTPPNGLRAAGDVRFSMITATLTMWLCRVALSIFLMRVVKTGPIGVWYGMFADWGVRGVIFTIRFVRGKWLRFKVKAYQSIYVRRITSVIPRADAECAKKQARCIFHSVYTNGVN